MQIVKYPDPVLEREGVPIETFDDALREKVRQMFELMYEARGVGLAAPQVGWSARLFIANPSADREQPELERVFINPEIKAQKGRVIAEEGCLSFPGLTFDVPRAKWVKMTAQDLDGEPFEIATDDPLISRILQHENDHLLGVLYITRMMPSDRSDSGIQRKLDEFREAYDRQQS